MPSKFLVTAQHKFLYSKEIYFMLQLAEKFPEQIEEALKIKIDFEFNDIEKIVLSGMGGSAISGDILSNFSKIPFFVIRDYKILPFADEKTLFIAVSYSGDTEETLNCYKEAIKKNCKIVAITSGGKLSKIAKNKILIPKGMQPRAAIAYLLFPLAKLLINFLHDINFEDVLYTIKSNKERIKYVAKNIADSIEGIPIIYGYGAMASIANRWRQQFNENAKMLAFNFSLPECNHNELEAWEKMEKMGEITCIFLRNKNEDDRIKIRYEFLKEVYGKKAKVIEVFPFGKNLFSETISMLYIGDFVSLYIANNMGIDTEPVNLIKKLKERLNQHSRSSS